MKKGISKVLSLLLSLLIMITAFTALPISVQAAEAMDTSNCVVLELNATTRGTYWYYDSQSDRYIYNYDENHIRYVLFTFIPEDTGIYRFASTDYYNELDATLYNSDMEQIDNCRKYQNFYFEHELIANNQYFLKVCLLNNSWESVCMKVTKTIAPTALIINEGDTISDYSSVSEWLSCSFLPADARKESVSWHSDDENIATVNDEGMVEFKNVGTTVITATSESGLTDSITVTTKEYLPTTGISIEGENFVYNVGNTVDLSAQFAPNGAKEPTVWSSSNEDVAEIISDSTFYGSYFSDGTKFFGTCCEIELKSVGSAVITVTTQSGFTDSVTITADNTIRGWSGYNCKWGLDEDGTLTISGDGEMGYNLSETLAGYGIEIKRVIIEDGVTNIGSSAFENCTQLTDISIADSVTRINYNSFENCTALTSIIIPGNVQRIDSFAFDNCTALTDVKLSEGITRIDCNAFNGCNSLKSIVIPKSVNNMGNGSAVPDIPFSGCDDITLSVYKDSYAETYARENGIPYVILSEEEPQTYTDEVTGVSVITADGSEYALDVTDQTAASEGDVAVALDERIEKVYDISLMKDGAETQPDGKVTVRIPCDNESARVYRVEADNSLTDMNAVYDNGYSVFETDHFSKYVLTVPKTIIYGDVDFNGVISIIDATAIQRYLVEYDTLTDNQLAAADTNGDGDVTIDDVTHLQRYLAEYGVVLGYANA